MRRLDSNSGNGSHYRRPDDGCGLHQRWGGPTDQPKPISARQPPKARRDRILATSAGYPTGERSRATSDAVLSVVVVVLVTVGFNI